MNDLDRAHDILILLWKCYDDAQEWDDAAIRKEWRSTALEEVACYMLGHNLLAGEQNERP